MPQHACEADRVAASRIPDRRTLHTPPFLSRKWDICATAMMTRAGGVHARTQVPQRAHPGGAAARRHERGALQLLARQPRVPPGTPAQTPWSASRSRSCQIVHDMRVKPEVRIQSRGAWSSLHLCKSLDMPVCTIKRAPNGACFAPGAAICVAYYDCTVCTQPTE